MKPLRMDLHMHSHYSACSYIRPEQILDRAKEAGLNVISVTDHNTTRGSLDVSGLAAERHDNIIVLIGQEVMTRQGEIIVYDLDYDIRPRRDIAETCKEARANGGFIIVPHPFDSVMRTGAGRTLPRILKHIDAIEGFNSRCLAMHSNRKAMDFARRHGIPAVAGSDAHVPEEIGTVENLVFCRPEKEEIFRAIREKRFLIEARKARFSGHVKTFLHKRGLIK